MQKLVDRARQMGFHLHWRTVSDLELGKRQDPQLSTLLAIAGALGVELSRLVQVVDDFSDLPEEPPAIKKAKTHVEVLREKIKRKDYLIRKWKREADACDPSDWVGRVVKRYCRGLARWQQEEVEKLESELRSMK